jgi:hypothetical protein
VLKTRLTDAGTTAFEQADAHAVAVEQGLAVEFTGEELKTLRSLPTRCAKVLRA